MNQSKKLTAAALTLTLCLLTGCGAASSAPASSAASSAAASSAASASSVASSVASASETSGVIRATIPEGFTASTMDGCDEYYADADGNSINLVTTDADTSVSSVTEDQLISAYQTAFDKQYGEGVTVVSPVSFTGESLMGHPGYAITFSIAVNGTTLTESQYAVVTDKSYIWTFTAVTDAYATEFASAESYLYEE